MNSVLVQRSWTESGQGFAHGSKHRLPRREGQPREGSRQLFSGLTAEHIVWIRLRAAIGPRNGTVAPTEKVQASPHSRRSLAIGGSSEWLAFLLRVLARCFYDPNVGTVQGARHRPEDRKGNAGHEVYDLLLGCELQLKEEIRWT